MEIKIDEHEIEALEEGFAESIQFLIPGAKVKIILPTQSKQ